MGSNWFDILNENWPCFGWKMLPLENVALKCQALWRSNCIFQGDKLPSICVLQFAFKKGSRHCDVTIFRPRKFLYTKRRSFLLHLFRIFERTYINITKLSAVFPEMSWIIHILSSRFIKCPLQPNSYFTLKCHQLQIWISVCLAFQ